MPGHRWDAATVDTVRALCTTTRLSLAAIRAKTGVPPGTIAYWRTKFGWTQPALGAAPPRPPLPARLLTPEGTALLRRELLGRILGLVEGYVVEAEARRVGPEVDIANADREARHVGTVLQLIQRHKEAELALGRNDPEARGGDEHDAEDRGGVESRPLDAVYREFAAHLAELFRDGGSRTAAAPGADPGGAGEQPVP
ncbi:MAG TPA: hypothetical protein VGU24_16470 [Microvirga sp.]|jgi:hypothetical protein|nr:hypothetical protein [Microvirga sp.]